MPDENKTFSDSLVLMTSREHTLFNIQLSLSLGNDHHPINKKAEVTSAFSWSELFVNKIVSQCAADQCMLSLTITAIY